MDWLPFAILTLGIVIVGLYAIVKWAVKDALKEYFEEKQKEE